jgi:membrane protein DedA with SNARE-associated domain/membrane-associated phospholipid phosphatase
MEHYLKHLVLWTYFHPNWAGLVVFLIALGESIPILGTIVPGSIVMTAIGTLIGAGILPFYVSLALASLGAFVGDSAGFMVGYTLKENIARIWPFKQRRHWLDKCQLFFKKHGRKSIFIARFIGPVRAFAPITAGAMQMKPLHFYCVDFVSAILWALVYMLPGILIGAFSLDLPPDLALHFIWWLLLGLAAIVIITWVIKIISLHIADVLNYSLNQLWRRGLRSPNFHFITKLLRHYNTRHPSGQLGNFFSLLFCFAAFLYIALHIRNHGSINELNMHAYHFFRSLRNLPTDKIMLGLSFCGSSHILLVPIVAAFVWLGYKRCWRAMIHWAGLIVISFGAITLLKPFVHSARPPGLAVAVDSTVYSFPSGHVTLAVAIFGFIAYLVASRFPPKIRWQCYLIASIAVLLEMIARLYLGAHWFTDLLGSMFLGLCCLLIIVISYQRNRAQRIQPVGFLLAFIIALALSWTVAFQTKFDKEIANYQPVWSKKIISMHKWWKDDGKDYPFFQVNRFGQPIHALNLQWAGDIETITKTLTKNGWHKPIPFSWVTAIQHPELSHKYALHIKTALFRDRKPNIILIKPISDGRTLLLRLWETGIQFEHSPKLLWAGALTIHTDAHHKVTKKDYQQLNQDTLRNTLSAIPNFQVETKAIKLRHIKLFDAPTHGELILIKPKHN